MKLFFILTSSLFLCLGAQAKFPAEGLIKTASSGAIQGTVSYTHLTLPTT